MTNPLPGMPLQLGDPGVFVCGPDDIAPWEKPRRTSNDVADVVPIRRPAASAWLVLSTCPDCLPRQRRYCDNHDAGNWWLTVSRLGR